MPLTPQEGLDLVAELVTLANRIRESAKDGWTAEERKAIAKQAGVLLLKLTRDLVD